MNPFRLKLVVKHSSNILLEHAMFIQQTPLRLLQLEPPLLTPLSTSFYQRSFLKSLSVHSFVMVTMNGVMSFAGH
jgi:hypothetical protein